MDIGRANKLKEKDLGKQLRGIRELQVAQYELESSKRSIYQQLPNSNVFLVSTKPEQERRVKKELKKKIEQFREERIGTSFEREQIKL